MTIQQLAIIAAFPLWVTLAFGILYAIEYALKRNRKP